MDKRATKYEYLEASDVLKTTPFDGYWGCTLVLTASDQENGARLCYIGITPLVFTHDYQFEDIETSNLTILGANIEIRVAPNQYAHLRRSPCIGIYGRVKTPNTKVIGRIDVNHVYPHPLTYQIGNGADRGWPLYGVVPASLGTEAVHEWRAIHDTENLAADIAAAQASHEQMLSHLASKSRGKRNV
ncbi:MAG: hypothetical protein FWC42_02270 [Proteobacteria bacterium]|nr:hypothetical protein [Pseudomonadota bacterium]